MKPAAVDNRACERCHPQIAEEWQSSRHRHSFDNAEFQRSLGREKQRAFCVDCHAPATTRSGAPTAAEAELGVACVVCHSDPHGARPASTADACKGCHEFRFAQPRRDATSERAQWMQRTWSEHHDGNTAGLTACTACHMPRVDGHASHRFVGGHDEAFVKSALAVSARRMSAGGIELTLMPQNVTHAVPTGDLFRRLLVSADTEPASGHPTLRYLARHHQHVSREQRVEVADDRPFMGPSRVSLELGALAATRPIRYRVVYQRVDHLVGDDESQAVVDGEIELASGVVAAQPPSASKPSGGGCAFSADADTSATWLCVLVVAACVRLTRRRPTAPVFDGRARRLRNVVRRF